MRPILTLPCPCGKKAFLDIRRPQSNPAGQHAARFLCSCGRRTQWQESDTAQGSRIEAIKVWYQTRGNEAEIRP